MNRPHKLALCFLFVASLGLESSPTFADGPLTMTVNPDNTVLLQTFDKPPVSLNSSSALSQSAQGAEASQCQPYGRVGDATGGANITVLKHSDEWWTLTLHSTASTRGGHYRTCDGCFANACIGIHGNDTTSSARASANAVVTLSFDPSYQHPIDYLLSVSMSGTEPLVSLTNDAGGPMTLTGKDGGPALIKGIPGESYFVKLALPLASTNSGGCCGDTQDVSSTVDIRIRRAPILTSAYTAGYLVGGKQANGYRYVGALLLDGKLQCTGTLISSRTVITAAHCLAGFDPTKMTFVLGSNYQYPGQNGGPFNIESVAYPDGKDAPFHFNEKTLEDDIGIVTLKQTINIPPARLYQPPPTWSDILNNHVSLLFVGFGFNVIDGDMVGLGIKREGAWEISDVTNRTVSFSVPGKNTCYGDSGGPAFLDTGNELQLIAITSGGGGDCTSGGVETRLDAYMTWISARLK
jgi:hypothetical protein